MLSEILKKINFFSNLDLRRKLQKFNLYPNFYSQNFFYRIYSKIIFNLVFFNRYNNLKKRLSDILIEVYK